MQRVAIGSGAVSISAARRYLRQQWKFLAPTQTIERADPAGHPATNEELQQSEVILLLGSNDPLPALQAARLYHLIRPDNPDMLIVASGKGGHATVPAPLFSDTEAATNKTKLVELGVPTAAIVTEPESANSGQNIIFSWRQLQALGLAPKRVVVIQSLGAQLRANLTFEKQWPDQDWQYYVSCPAPAPEIGSLELWDLAFHLAYALREVATIIEYYSKPDPFVAEITVPPEILSQLAFFYNLQESHPKKIKLTELLAHREDLFNGFREIFARMEAELNS